MTTDHLAVGERVLLRRWRAEDADAVFDACQDPEVQRWTTVPTPYEREHAEEFVTAFSDHQWATGESAPCALTLHDGTLVGSIGVVEFDGPVCTVGYWTAPAHRGAGLTTEGLRLLVKWLFAERGAVRVRLEADVRNGASRAVARKAGFVEEHVGAEMAVYSCSYSTEIDTLLG
ncbi:MAG: GNAT family N-acetyltransferase [Umezawaea sp.]